MRERYTCKMLMQKYCGIFCPGDCGDVCADAVKCELGNRANTKGLESVGLEDFKGLAHLSGRALGHSALSLLVLD